jgi:hypothetical protein
MTDNRAYRWLMLGAFTAVSTLAQAASGFSVTQADEKRVATGMSTADVQRSLGPPARVIQYPNQPGPTWIYQVPGAPFGLTEFAIDFGPDNRVVSASEIVIGNEL